MLDLATQWLAEDIPLPWLIDESLDDLKALSAEQQAQRQDEFEAKLVAAITETRRDIDWLFLALALVEPMDSQMIQDIVLQSDDQQKAEDLFERAKTFIFIKVLPDGRIRLHDEMRRMIKKHAWPLVDPDKDRWRAICQIGAGYLERVMQDTETKIAALKAAKKHKSADRDVEAFLEQDGLERTLWVDRVRQLELILEANLQKGIDRFRRLFDEASSVDFRESVLGKVGEYEKHFDLSQRYDYTLRLVQQRYDRGQHRQVKDRVSAFLEQHAAELTPRQQMALQIEYGVAEVNLGDPNAGVERLTEAITIGEEHQLQDKLAEVHNIRGWAYRTRGSYDDALQDYKQAYALSLEQRNRSDMAQALNQIGYVEGLKGERNLAIEHCQQALKSWESLKKSGGIVSTCSSLGEIYWWSDEPDRAMKLYERALTIADQAILSDWSARVRCKRALIFCDQQLYAEAQADLAYAWDNGPNILRPRIRHGEGTVLRKQGKIEQAYQKFNEALELSRQMYETEYEFQSFFALADLAWEQRQFATWQQFDEQYRERFADSLIVSLKGGALRAIGDLALGAGQYDKALELYQKGLPLIAKYLDPPFTVTLQLGIIESRLMERQDVQQMMTQLGKDLMEFWQKQPELLDRHPEALLIFDEWQQKGQEV
ncbi:MAG: tetratricopeptide repeat protein [Chloroflexaceae bacterium]|nr:tetratricopeptide repeat protein [Chloroflexaceae bacterium]